jgi:DNA-binding SARP family transcriptional activator
MALLQLSLLGEFRCRSAGAEPAFTTRKVRALLVYLAASGAERHGRDKLVALLWGDRPEAEARANLRKTVSRLRAALPAAARGALIADAGQVAVRSDALEVDVLLFERLVADGTPESLERAAALYRGPFLEGFAGCGEEFDEWLGTERRRLDELLQQTLQRLLDHYVVTGGIDRAIQIALAADRFRPVAGERPPRSDPALHVPGSGGLGAGPVPPLSGAARPRARRRAGAGNGGAEGRAVEAAAR